MTDRLLTVAESALKYRVHPSTVHRWINEKGLKIEQAGKGGAIRISESVIKEFMEREEKL